MLATVLPIAAAVNAGLLAAALAQRAWVKRSRVGFYGAAFLLCAAAAIALIALDHAGAFLDARLSACLEGALTLLAGPLMLIFVAGLLGRRLRAWPLLAPFAGSLVAALLWPAWAMQAFVVERLVVVQMLFTAAAGAVVLAYAPAGRRGVQARNLAAVSVAALVVLHLAQTMRLLWPSLEAIREIVPLVGAAAFLAATCAVYFGGRIGALEPLVEAPSPADGAARALVAALDVTLRSGLLREADMTLARAAAALQAQPGELSRALLATHRKSFSEYLQGLRIEEAKRLLDDPAEARTSMEAIGLLAGFGSRSGFYKAFCDQVGVSPAAWRARKPVQSSETGH
jgi:AraC-like DNA-binding protein